MQYRTQVICDDHHIALWRSLLSYHCTVRRRRCFTSL